MDEQQRDEIEERLRERLARPAPDWEHQRWSRVDRALGRMACAVQGHRWWTVIDVKVCGQCGKVSRVS